MTCLTPPPLPILQKRRGMDIKQMKTFVSEELKGLKQEHRLLSLRERYGSILHCASDWVFQVIFERLHCWRALSLSDIGASESIMKKKTKQDFQEMLKTEHCKKTQLCPYVRIRFKLCSLIINVSSALQDVICSVIFLLVCCYWCIYLSFVFCSSVTWRIWNPWMHFIHRGAHQQTGAFAKTQIIIMMICWKHIYSFIFSRSPW